MPININLNCLAGLLGAMKEKEKIHTLLTEQEKFFKNMLCPAFAS